MKQHLTGFIGKSLGKTKCCKCNQKLEFNFKETLRLSILVKHQFKNYIPFITYRKWNLVESKRNKTLDLYSFTNFSLNFAYSKLEMICKFVYFNIPIDESLWKFSRWRWHKVNMFFLKYSFNCECTYIYSMNVIVWQNRQNEGNWFFTLPSWYDFTFFLWLLAHVLNSWMLWIYSFHRNEINWINTKYLIIFLKSQDNIRTGELIFWSDLDLTT